ncbi:hypothetical protein O181_022374 [Austropuccinia psidii MF-1]|uniref:Uncharacterized protein n=1 Tax=Austropuccinia psidii MF-1 TaxID=1389203 RepID=A0A9Q3CEN0_9BASI|nr:hypothetical protein [Austropuccinia psidii MF-1]
MEPPGQPLILIGYNNNSTAYHIVRLSDSQASVTHYEAFNKNVFPSLPTTIGKMLSFSLTFNNAARTSKNDTNMEATRTCEPVVKTQEIE